MHTDDYSERLGVPVSWWLLGLLFSVAVGWAFFVATTTPVTVVAFLVAAALVGVTLARYGAARVVVDDDGLRAGRATLPWSAVGPAEPLDADATRRALGVEANAAAYLLVRSYCRTSVRVRVDDPRDPTPYWLVSTRRPGALADRLTAGAVKD